MRAPTLIHRVWGLKLLLLVGVVLVVSGVVGAAAARTHSQTATSSAIFRDYFTTTPDTNWTFYNRFGEVANGRLNIDGGYMPGQVMRNGWALTHVGDTSWTNYSYRVTYDTSNAGGDPPEVHMASFLFRVAAQGGNNLFGGTMYFVDIWDPGQPDGSGVCPGDTSKTGQTHLWKIANGQLMLLKFKCRSNTTIGTNAVTINANGPTISVIANGATLLRYTDPDPISYGGVGVMAYWEVNDWFDNAIVLPLG